MRQNGSGFKLMKDQTKQLMENHFQLINKN